MPRPKQSPWSVPSHVDVELPDDVNGLTEPRVRVLWEVDESTVIAYIGRHRGVTAVVGFSVKSGERGISPRVRALPPEGVVIQAARRLGDRALLALAYINDDLDALSRIGADLGIDDAKNAQSAPVLEVYGRQLAKRPRSRIAEQVAHAMELMRGGEGVEGLETARVVEVLILRCGISEATAYRRVREARRRLAEVGGDR